jgi:lysozyme
MKTVTPKLQFLDLSHHQWPLNWDELRANPDLIAIGWKASEGNYMTDQYYDAARAEATKRGYLWLAYHFGTNNNVEQQVERFLNVAKPNSGTRLCLDWEDYGDKQMTPDQVVEFLHLLDDRTGRVNTIYSGNTAKEMLGNTKNAFLGSHPLWIPRYAATLTQQPVPQVSWDSWDIWQYAADGAGMHPNQAVGVNGHPDCNVFYNEEDAVRSNWSGITTKPETPVIKPEQLVTITISAPPGITINVVKIVS